MTVAFLDPGSAKECALAFFDEQLNLVQLAWHGAKYRHFAGPPVKPIVGITWEKPQYYPGQKKKVDPNKLIDLAISGASVAAQYGPPDCVKMLTAPQWKGQIAKPAHHMQLWAILSPAERMLFPDGTDSYIRVAARCYAVTGAVQGYSAAVVDLLDATALGCFCLGRLAGPTAGRVKRPSTKKAKAAWHASRQR